jgi:hypothetical protein
MRKQNNRTGERQKMKLETVGKGKWHIVVLTPQKVLEMASTIALQMSQNKKIDNCYWNKTLDGQFRIQVRND